MDAKRFIDFTKANSPVLQRQSTMGSDNGGRYIQASMDVASNAQRMNQQAAMVGAEQMAAQAQTTQATAVERGEVDTATPGGTSGRRRRGTQPTGSIRI